jgi:hypothetical protein
MSKSGGEWQQKEREKDRHLDRSFAQFVGHRLVPGRLMMAEGAPLLDDFGIAELGCRGRPLTTTTNRPR